MVTGKRTVYLGLGANLGPRKTNIRKALKLLREKVEIVKVSSLYQTAPVGYTDQPDFINAAAEIRTVFSPRQLLRLLKQVEKNIGRVKTFRNGPRHIDIDILLYEGESVITKKLTIPHPQINNRDFVLRPLREIAPRLDKKVFRWKK
jgi:2-amino-4-hydroxy-6-hydroxymethyldihydropteridine diphosphokinase